MCQDGNCDSLNLQTKIDINFNNFVLKSAKSLTKIEPIFILCSTEGLRKYLNSFLSLNNSVLTPPLCSITMIDVFPKEGCYFENFAPSSPSIIHCINNTEIVNNVCWWNNSS